MKMLNKKIISVVVLGCFILSGCVGRPANFGEINKNKTDLSKVDFTKGREITARSGGFQLFLLIPLGVNGRQERALEKLQEKAGDNYIDNVRVSEVWRYAFVGNSYSTRIKATVYPYKN